MALILVCRCGTQHDVSDGALCRACQADDACADDRAELVRLWRKREGYRRRGIPVAPTDDQARRCQMRMQRACAAIDDDPKRAHDLFQRQLRVAGESRGRILLPGGTA